MLEGAACELAGLGQPAEAQPGDGVERGAHDRAAAVQVQLDHRLARLGVGRGEPHDQATVERLASRGIEQRAQRHAARRRQRLPGELFQWHRRRAGPLRRMTASAPDARASGVGVPSA